MDFQAVSFSYCWKPKTNLKIKKGKKNIKEKKSSTNCL